MKRFCLSLMVLLVLGGFALTAQAQSGRVRSATGTPSDTGPFSDPVIKPAEEKSRQDETLRPGNVRVELPALVNGERIYRPKEVDRKVIVIKKYAAVFVQEARKRRIEGIVRLRVIFSATGEVRDITVVAGLPYGLSESAVKAARKVRFQPAMKDGKPVSIWALLEYEFTLY